MDYDSAQNNDNKLLDSAAFKDMLKEYNLTVEDFTCTNCTGYLKCPYYYDPYSTHGDCLALK